MQLKLFKNGGSAFGGDLLKRRKHRHARPLSTRDSMHLVLRSSRAKGAWSLKRHARKVNAILDRFADKYAVKIVGRANVGSHLHLEIKLGHRHTYRAFIRAITGAIAMAVTGASRWRKIEGKFWDRRPWTRVVTGWKAVRTLRDYMLINQMEGQGYSRQDAEDFVRGPPWDPRPRRSRVV